MPEACCHPYNENIEEKSLEREENDSSLKRLEEVREEIFEGTYILDGLRLTEEQQREKIFNLMIQAGVEVTKEEIDKLEILINLAISFLKPGI